MCQKWREGRKKMTIGIGSSKKVGKYFIVITKPMGSQAVATLGIYTDAERNLLFRSKPVDEVYVVNAYKKLTSQRIVEDFLESKKQ